MILHYARSLSLGTLVLATAAFAQADRVYIMNAPGYNSADPELVTAIQSLGHTVDVSAMGATDLPPNFASACVSGTGYDWLCFFGNQDRSNLVPQVQTFLADGGKVLLQYEVSCCEIASLSAATMASGLTGATITPNIEPYIAISGVANLPGWEAVSPEACLNIAGNAYKCMDGLPAGKGLLATGTLNAASPDHTTCTNFGFRFLPSDLPGNSGGIVGFGDINLYYQSAGEPPNSGGTNPVDMAVVELIFPTDDSPCALLPAGCLENSVPDAAPAMIGAIYPNPANDQMTIDLLAGLVQEVRVFNAQGQCVFFERPNGQERMRVATGQLADGLYHLMVSSAHDRQEASFMIAH